ncbi:MAG: DUF2721 domain-containing protein [Ignavibacteria bacterium]|nr:DUF2721 domain-containing protein [Ignavibacteria bacterium]
MLDIDTFIKAIQMMLAPAVMISACGLMLLAINNKHSSIVNRIRLLNEERRRYMLKLQNNVNIEFVETLRLQSINKQLDDLLMRLRLVRNGIVFHILGIFMFILTSLVIGAELIFRINLFDPIKIITFSTGLILVLVGVIFALIETIKGYKIVYLDVKADE